jgi:hypothetical protein
MLGKACWANHAFEIPESQSSAGRAIVANVLGARDRPP